MQYRAETEGFTGHFATLDALKAWVHDLNDRYYGRLTGKVCRVYKAVHVCADGSGAEYSVKPGFFREIVIGA